MSKDRSKEQPTAETFNAGDRIEIVVDAGRMLPVGVYDCTVSAVAQHAKNLGRVTVLYLRHGKQSFMFSVHHQLRFQGYGFLGKDEYPVRYRRIEENLEPALAGSIGGI